MNEQTLEKIALWAALGFGFFSVIPYAIAGKNIFTALMLVSLLFFAYNRRLCLPKCNWINGSFLLVLAVALLSALLSPALGDSLTQIRKETLPFLMAFVLLVCTRAEPKNAIQNVRYFIYALVSAYLIKEGLAIGDGFSNDFIFSIYETPDNTLPRYLDFFATDTVFYLPLLMAVAGFWPMRSSVRLFLWIAIFGALAVVAVSGVRTTFVMALFELMLFLLIRFWRFKNYFVIATVVLVSLAYGAKDYVTNPSLARYYSIFTPKTYVSGNDGSVSERFAIARAVWEVSQDRKWIGYGPGWKKLPTVAEEHGYMAQWADSAIPWQAGAYRYFSYGEGRVNPHNLYAQFIFEVGILGLGAYLIMLVVLGIRSGIQLLHSGDSENQGMAYAGLAYVIVYLVAGMSGGIWLPITLLVYLAWFSLQQQRDN